MQRCTWRLGLIQRFVGWRNRRATASPTISTPGKVGSPDLLQAKMRFLVLVGCVVYGVSVGVFDEGLTRSQAFIFGLDAALFGLFALYTHELFKLHPKPNHTLRAIGLFADHGAALACLAVTGRDAGALAWLPLFIIQGVGIRFGVRWLYVSQAIGVASVGIICTVNPFFRENVTVGLGAILSVLVLPLYFALLAKREARIKDALQQARLEAEKANAAKGRFVAMISHELRTPLTGISGLNELLRQQELPEYTQSLLAEQGAATALMLEMVNDVLDLSKVEDGAAQLQETSFDPQQLALNVVHGLAFQAKRKGLAVYTELDASLPAALQGSPFHVSRILQNLLGNAIKFTSEGSITLRVRRDESVAFGGVVTVHFEVADTGIGIPAASLPRIYDRFYQVDAAITRRFGGTGLGTSLVKEFCDLLGGSVRIESQLGIGTRCHVALPFKPATVPYAADNLSVGVAEVGVCAEGIVDWPRIKSQLIASGVSVFEVPARNGSRATAVGRTPIVLLSGYLSRRSRTELTDMGFEDPTYIVLQDFDSPMLFAAGLSGVAIRARPDAPSIVRAVGLALLGRHNSRAAAPFPPRIEQQQTSPATPSALKVLLAEDSPAVQLVMRATLENAGFFVEVANDGAEALSNALRVRHDVIVLDWNMPNLDGIEVLRRLRNTSGVNQRTPVVIATAAPSKQLIEQATAAGAWSILGKPFVGAEFVLAVKSAAKAGPLGSPIATAGTARSENLCEEITVVLDLETLEASHSIFRTGDHIKLIGAFTRDVSKQKDLLEQALATADLSLFRSCIHSLTGYAGMFGARRLEWLLANAPHDESSLKTEGPRVVSDLCESMRTTAQALDEWSRSFLCSTQ